MRPTYLLLVLALALNGCGRADVTGPLCALLNLPHATADEQAAVQREAGLRYKHVGKFVGTSKNMEHGSPGMSVGHGAARS